MGGELTTQIILEISHAYKQLLGKGPNWVTIDVSRDIAIVRINNNYNKAQLILMEMEETNHIFKKYFIALLEKAVLPEIEAICENNWKVKVKESVCNCNFEEKLISLILFMHGEIEA